MCELAVVGQPKQPAQPAFTQSVCSLEFSSATIVFKNLMFPLHTLFPYSTLKEIVWVSSSDNQLSFPLCYSHGNLQSALFLLTHFSFPLNPSRNMLSNLETQHFCFCLYVYSWKKKKKRWRSIWVRKKITTPPSFPPGNPLHINFMG